MSGLQQISDCRLSVIVYSVNDFRRAFDNIQRQVVEIVDICRQYQVRRRSIDLWRQKYGSMQEKKERLIIETESDTLKIIELQKRVAELERIVGQKQIEIDFKDKMIDLAEEMYHVDIKKKLSTQSSSGSENI